MDLRSVRVKSFSRSFRFISQTSSSLSRRALFFTSSLSLRSIGMFASRKAFLSCSLIHKYGCLENLDDIPLQNNPSGFSTLMLSHRDREDIKTRSLAPQTKQLHSLVPSQVQLQLFPKFSHTKYESTYTFGFPGRQFAVSTILLRETAYTSSTQRLSPSSHCMTVWAEHITGRIAHNNMVLPGVLRL